MDVVREVPEVPTTEPHACSVVLRSPLVWRRNPQTGKMYEALEETTQRWGLPTKPWWEKMTPEELEVIRNKEYTPRYPRWQKEALAFKSRGATRVDAQYRKANDSTMVNLMVGVLFPHPQHGLSFYHAYSREEGGSGHEYEGSNCPVPVDTVVVDFLHHKGVDYYYAHDEDNRVLWRAKVQDLKAAPVQSMQARTVRYRHLLDIDGWVAQSEVRAMWTRDKSRRLTRKTLRVFDVPWAEAKVLLRSTL